MTNALHTLTDEHLAALPEQVKALDAVAREIERRASPTGFAHSEIVDLARYIATSDGGDNVACLTTPTDRDREVYLVRKGGYFYRPNAQGYTANPDEAGRFTWEDAWAYSHPNGDDGPRDGIDIVHQREAPAYSPRRMTAPDGATIGKPVSNWGQTILVIFRSILPKALRLAGLRSN